MQELLTKKKIYCLILAKNYRKYEIYILFIWRMHENHSMIARSTLIVKICFTLRLEVQEKLNCTDVRASLSFFFQNSSEEFLNEKRRRGVLKSK